MDGNCKKSCGRCSNYGSLVNQGQWWCNAGHTENMDAENCEDYHDSQEGMTMSTMGSIPNKPARYYDDRRGTMAEYKMIRAKKRRKKERGIKHGSR